MQHTLPERASIANITLISGSTTGGAGIRRGTSGGKAGSCRFSAKAIARSVIRGSVNFGILADNQLNAVPETFRTT